MPGSGHADSRSTAELDTRRPPLRVAQVLLDIFDGISDRHHTDRIGIGFAKHGSQPRNLVCLSKRHFFGVDRSGFLDPGVANVLDLDEILHDDGLVVTEIEAEFSGSDKGPLLVDMVSEDFSKCEI
jgi:hypothetical protein